MEAPPTSLYVNPEGIPWVERRPGVLWKVLWEDPGRGHKTILVQYAPGAVVPCHRHIGDEQIYVLEGSVVDDTGICGTGEYARRPPGCVHTVTSPEGALVLAVVSGLTEPA